MESNVAQPSQESASLLRRLAGASTGKAGLAKDQSEINRVIAEASKGSKFYENEKKKDKDLTERINRILNQRDSALRGVDTRKVEKSVDELLTEIESQRDLSQFIVHVDMDAFYANVELLDDPSLKAKPFGVGLGVLCTASYEARKYGVRSGMPGFIAKKLCPELIILPLNYTRYTELSNDVMSVFKRYDPNMSIAGCDEGYLNITAYCREHKLTAEECVRKMRQEVEQETRLTASAGIAPNKMLAKICSDKNKPNGQFFLPFDSKSIILFMRDLSIRKIPGIGRVNERLLESIGIKTCGDIYTYRATLSLMDKQFGLKFLLRTHLGIASNDVQPYRREERKSIGAERTFNSLGDKDKILQKLDEVATELESDMEQNGWTGRTVTLKFKLDTYQVFTRAKSFDRWISKKSDLYETGKELLLPEFPLKIRLIGLRVTKLKDLRAPACAVGIAKFFAPAQEPPSKKRKTEFNEHHDFALDESITSLDAKVELDHNDDDETMPGFHEHDEEDLDSSQQYAVDDNEEVELVQPREVSPRPAVSAPIPLATTVVGSSAKPNSTGHVPPLSTSRDDPETLTRLRVKPSSAQKVPQQRVSVDDEPLMCPICGKAQRTDNDGLNAHIDFCLSRQAIREAQADAGRPEEWKHPKKAKREKAGELGNAKSPWNVKRKNSD